MKYVLIVTLCSFCLKGLSQLPDYYVYLVSGSATIQKPGGKPAAMKPKQIVFGNDIIVLKSQTELTLVDHNSTYLVLNKPGSYQAGSLVKNASKKNTDGLTKEYLKLLFHELLDPHHDYEKFKKENIAGVVGGVSREDSCNNRIYPVKGLKTSASSITFRWNKTSPSSVYLLFVYDAEGKEISKLNVRDTMKLISVTETIQYKPGKYYWRVTSNDGTCEDEFPIPFEILTTAQQKEMTDMLLAGKKGETIESQLGVIDILAKNSFIDAASARYASLLKENPDDSALRLGYVSFLLKYGNEEAAVSTWK